MSKFLKTGTTLLAASVISLTAVFSAYAADAAPSQSLIAVVDTQKIFEKATALQKIKEQLDKKADAFKTESSQKEDYFKKKFDELEKQKSILSESAFQKKSDDLGKEFADAQKKVQENRQVLDKAYVDAMQQVNDTFAKIVSEEASKKGYKIVIPKLQTLFSDDKIEITDGMIGELNKRLPTVNVKFR